MVTRSNRAQPARIHVTITPLDATDLTPLGLTSVYILTDGNLAMQGAEGVTITYPVKAGQVVPFGPTKVMTATTCTLVGWR